MISQNAEDAIMTALNGIRDRKDRAEFIKAAVLPFIGDQPSMIEQIIAHAMDTDGGTSSTLMKLRVAMAEAGVRFSRADFAK